MNYSTKNSLIKVSSLELDLSLIDEDPNQPRTEFDPVTLQELSDTSSWCENPNFSTSSPPNRRPLYYKSRRQTLSSIYTRQEKNNPGFYRHRLL